MRKDLNKNVKINEKKILMYWEIIRFLRKISFLSWDLKFKVLGKERRERSEV